jgi:hypothetical protein
MESNKDSFLIADYSVSQTTLDQVFINFAKTQRGKDSEDEDDDDEIEEADGDATSNNGDENTYYDNNQRELKSMKNDTNNINSDQITVNIPPIDPRFDSRITDDLNNHTPTFESIKNHFNSLKKKGHIRKTSSAKSMQRKQSTRSRKSEMSRSSSKRRRVANDSGGGYNNLAYEIEFKNSDSYPPYQYDISMQEASHDLTTSINEDGEYFSRC